MPTLEERLARLEKSHRRYRLATASLLLCLLASLSLGQITLGGGTGGIKAPMITSDHLLLAKSLTLDDPNGKPRFVLSTDTDEPLLQIKDPDGHNLLSLSATDKAATLLIQDPTGKKLFSAP